MILSELRAFIIANPACTRTELANVFALSEDGVDAMLSVWVKKGKLKIKLSQSQSGLSQVHYNWITDEQLSVRLLK